MSIDTRCTRYVGVHVTERDGHWWIDDDRGCDQYIGRREPTDAEVETYVHDATNGQCGHPPIQIG